MFLTAEHIMRSQEILFCLALLVLLIGIEQIPLSLRTSASLVAKDRKLIRPLIGIS